MLKSLSVYWHYFSILKPTEHLVIHTPWFHHKHTLYLFTQYSLEMQEFLMGRKQTFSFYSHKAYHNLFLEQKNLDVYHCKIYCFIFLVNVTSIQRNGFDVHRCSSKGAIFLSTLSYSTWPLSLVLSLSLIPLSFIFISICRYKSFRTLHFYLHSNDILNFLLNKELNKWN